MYEYNPPPPINVVVTALPMHVESELVIETLITDHLGPVVRKLISPLHCIVIFSTVLKILIKL